ncbi:MAG: glycosyltransferase [Ignavibacteriales bacterium]|nr:glycosyltransferase [Ignavibacteriales bacterium]
MKVLIICSGNAGYISPFVKEQAEAISKLGVEIEIYPIVGKGVWGYLNNLSKIKKKIKEFSPDLVHAHYGLSGLVSCLQRVVPVVITFHGSDAYIPM